MTAWSVQCGYTPAAHHQIIIDALEELVSNLIRALVRGYEVPEEPLRLMVLTPPGSAKSTYLSKLFPPWFLAQFARLCEEMEAVQKKAEQLGILACSHSADIAMDFGYAARNLIISNNRWLGYRLNTDRRAQDKWAVSNGCYYQAAGVNSGISGRRMHLGLIDDFCGQEQDAGSQLFNDQTWVWYENDFVNRLQPISARIIIANHRNEDDLVGRLMAKEASKWKIIRLRLLIENEEQAEEDPLHRSVGDYLWPEYFTRAQVDERMSNPRASGIQQQEPSPQEGGFFKKDWLLGYNADQLHDMTRFRLYASSDHAVSEKQSADLTCLLPAGFANGQLFVLPDVAWDRYGSKQAVEAMLKIARDRRPLCWWAEKGHISKSIGPFLQDRMMDEKVYVNLTEVTPVKDKLTRAQSIHGMLSMGLVRFPKFAPWWSRAERELLMFPNGKHDDFVDALALMGMGINQMVGPGKKRIHVEENVNVEWKPTMRFLKDTAKRQKRNLMIREMDR